MWKCFCLVLQLLPPQPLSAASCLPVLYNWIKHSRSPLITWADRACLSCFVWGQTVRQKNMGGSALSLFQWGGFCLCVNGFGKMQKQNVEFSSFRSSAVLLPSWCHSAEVWKYWQTFSSAVVSWMLKVMWREFMWLCLSECFGQTFHESGAQLLNSYRMYPRHLLHVILFFKGAFPFSECRMLECRAYYSLIMNFIIIYSIVKRRHLSTQSHVDLMDVSSLNQASDQSHGWFVGVAMRVGTTVSTTTC